MNELTKRLERMRSELRADLDADVAVLSREIDDKGEDTTPSQHPADVASDLYAREEMLADELTLERELDEVEDALARLTKGIYGTCVECGRPIATERLTARP